MQKILFTLLLGLGLFSCRNSSAINGTGDTVTFNVLIKPSFDESATFTLSKVDTVQQLKCIILDGNRNDRPAHTFYSKTIVLSDEEFNKFDSTVVQKTRVKQTRQKEGCCDGVYFQFKSRHNNDSSMLHFGNLSIGRDTTACKIIALTLENLALLYNDSVISDYFNDINSYIYDSVKHIQYRDNRAINRLRKTEYNR
jgi:hypothetical protein